MADPLDEFRHLWDGSEDGWWLAHTSRPSWRLTFHFAPDGPTLEEIVRLREIAEALRDRKLPDVHAELRGREAWEYPHRLGEIEHHRLSASATRAGFHVTSECRDTGHDVPMRGDVAVLIEDEALLTEVTERMRAAGVPVRTVCYVD
jgi:hypothetical protein